ncbi:hypothetical protein BDZ97DRAFT_1656512 [Flammula alnicola]|nr:hypothetical protein BDZ97DRAFT_1656512 [Flammula alnicola]
MPGWLKQVRFAYKNSYHSPPPTPALSFSSSTISSGSGPLTPPYATQGLPGPTPYTIPYAPSKHLKSSRYVGSVRAHPLLEMGAITWDVMDHPSTIRRDYNSVPNHTFREAATNPPLAYLSITSPHLPWVIKVYASNGSFVTLEDVFTTIYRALRINITPAEFSSLPSPNDQRRATRAYEQRYRRQRSTRIYEEEKRGGMKRVDFLMGCTRFFGISNSGRRPDEWHLDVS